MKISKLTQSISSFPKTQLPNPTPSLHFLSFHQILITLTRFYFSSQRLTNNPNFHIPRDDTRRVAKKLGDAIRTKLSCPSCRLGVGLLQKAVRRGGSFNEIKEQFVGICVAFKIQIETVCAGIFDVYGPEVLPVLEASEIG